VTPLVVGGLAGFEAWAEATASGDEGPVVVDHVLVVDGDVGLGGGEALVAEELGGDVDGQSGGDSLGGEDAPEVVGREPQRASVGADGAGQGDGSVEQGLDAQRGEDLLAQTPWALEQERQRRAVKPFGLVVAADQW